MTAQNTHPTPASDTPTTEQCIDWLDAADKSPLLTPRIASLISALRAQLLAGIEVASAAERVIFLSDRKADEWDRAKAAIAALKKAGGGQ